MLTSNPFVWGDLVWGELGAGSYEGVFCIGITVAGDEGSLGCPCHVCLSLETQAPCGGSARLGRSNSQTD